MVNVRERPCFALQPSPDRARCGVPLHDAKDDALSAGVPRDVNRTNGSLPESSFDEVRTNPDTGIDSEGGGAHGRPPLLCSLFALQASAHLRNLMVVDHPILITSVWKGVMATRVGTGAASHSVAKTAVGKAVQKAISRLRGAKPTYGFLFVSPNLDFAGALAAAREASGAEIIGCTTAGEITEDGLTHGGVAIMLVASDVTMRVEFARGLKADAAQVAQRLASGLPDAKRAATATDHRHLTTVLLTDGLGGAGERLVSDLYAARVQAGTQIVGGAAGDEGKFAATLVGAAGELGSDAAAALHVFGASPWGIGVDHGLRPTTKQMRVTKAEGNVVFEIDGKPAFSAYEKHAAERGIQLSADKAGAYMIANELGVHFFERIGRARAPLSVGRDGSLACAGDIPRGSMVSILDGDADSMVRAAQSASEEARAALRGRATAGVLLFDCVCRGMILKTSFHREVDAVRSTFGDVPIAGFLTYGEIARSQERMEGWHNTTAVVVAIPE